MMARKTYTFLAVAAALLSATAAARASTYWNGSNPLANDAVYWSQFGLTFTGHRGVWIARSTPGEMTVTVRDAGGYLERRDQYYGFGWNGNFSANDKLLWTGGENGPMTIHFALPVKAAGAHIQADWNGPFTAQIQAFDISGNFLGSVSIYGNSNTKIGTAVFLGIQDSESDIAYITLGLTDASYHPTDFAINDLRLIDYPSTRQFMAVSSPVSWWLPVPLPLPPAVSVTVSAHDPPPFVPTPPAVWSGLGLFAGLGVVMLIRRSNAR